MFMFKAQEIIKEIDKFSPEILLSCRETLKKVLLILIFRD